MNYEIIQPNPFLSPYIRYYWILEVEKVYTPEPYRVIPQGCVELMFYFADPYYYLEKTGNKKTVLPYSFISGQQSRYFDLQAIKKIGIFSIIFRPHSARMFFNIPMHHFMNNLVALSDLLGNQARELEEKIISANTNKQRVSHIEQYFIKRLIEQDHYDFRRFTSAVQSIIQSNGEVTIDDLAKNACLGYKQFERKFSQNIGMSPKQYLKVVRFQNVLYTKQQHPHLNLTNLAFSCGYYDQAHFIHDFKYITGMTPKQYFSQALPYSDFFTP